jgi:hypothetical protein
MPLEMLLGHLLRRITDFASRLYSVLSQILHPANLFYFYQIRLSLGYRPALKILVQRAICSISYRFLTEFRNEILHGLTFRENTAVNFA